jgi:transcriptional regulator of acetoin/glycerol metabolism
MSGRNARRRLASAERAVAVAWERFAAGEEFVEGIRPEILDSWLRCRDEHRVDPQRDRAPLADAAPPPSAEESVVAAELGAAAARLALDVEAAGGVVAVADGRGRVLATWGESPSARRGGEQNLGPLFSWAEHSTGTTGVGTALASRGLVCVNRFEHWCSAFHDWSCAALAVRDPVTGAAVGAIDISVWDRPLPPAATDWLRAAVAGVEERLRLRVALGVASPTPPQPQPGLGPERLVGVRGARLVLVPV